MIKPIIKKILLVLFGLLLSLAFIELLIQSAGFAVVSFQKYKNNKILKNKSQYNIICIGESTTYRQYPVQLQEILNKTYPATFSIIDCGIGGASLETIFNNLDSMITEYNPHIAVCMLGGLDIVQQNGDNSEDISNNTFLKNIKLYKLFFYRKKYFLPLKNSKEVFADKINMDNNIEQALAAVTVLRSQEQYEKAVKILQDILNKDSKNEHAYYLLTDIYFLNLRQYEEIKNKSYNMSLNAIEAGFIYGRIHYYEMIIEHDINNNNIAHAKKFADMAINDDKCVLSVFFYGLTKNIFTKEQQETVLQKLLAVLTEPDKSYGAMGIYCMENKDFDKADTYFNMAENLRMKYYAQTKKNMYRLIVRKLIDSNIKVICMQYPVRSIKPLQNILKDTPYYDKITFISNEEIFKKALKENPYNKMFKDQFGGDYGHCTDYGNTLIAQNLAKTLTDLTK